MSYLPTGLLVAAGLVRLGLGLVRVLRHARRFGVTASVAGTRIGDRTGTLRARFAALRVAMKQTRVRVKHTPADVRSTSRGRQEDDRG